MVVHQESDHRSGLRLKLGYFHAQQFRFHSGRGYCGEEPSSELPRRASYLFFDQMDGQTQTESIWRGTISGVASESKSDTSRHASVSASDTAFSWLLGGGDRVFVQFQLVGPRQLRLSKDTFVQSRAEPPQIGLWGHLRVWEPPINVEASTGLASAENQTQPGNSLRSRATHSYATK